jgi:hypothetical protein
VTLLLSVVAFGLLAVLFIVVWSRSSNAALIGTPLLLFGIFEIVSVWPATIYAQIIGASATGAFPALLAGLGFAALLLGFVVVTAMASSSPDQPAAFRASPIRFSYSASSYGLATAAMACVLTALGLYLYDGVPPFVEGLIALGSGGGIDTAINIIANGREVVTKSHYLGGAYRGQGLILELMQDGWPYLVAVASLLFVRTRRRQWLFTAAMLAMLMLFFIAGSGQRWQVVAAILYLGLVSTLAARVSVRSVISVALVGTLVYGGMSVLNSNYEDIGQTADPVSDFFARAGERIVLGNGMHNVEGINFVDNGSLQFGLGSIHAQKFFTSIPGVGKDEVPFALRLALLLDPFRPAEDSTYASQTYFGWLYDDFGLPGVVVVYFLFGGLLALAQRWIFTRPKGLLDLPALAFVIYYLGEFSLDGPASVTASLVVVSALWIGLHVLAAAAEPRRVRSHPLASPTRSVAAVPRLQGR